MKCTDFLDQLSAYMDGELSPDEMDAMRNHAKECPSCGEALAQAENVRQQLRALRSAKPPIGFTEHMMDAVRAADQQENPKRAYRPKKRRFGWRSITGIAAAAAALLIAVPLLGGMLLQGFVGGDSTVGEAEMQQFSMAQEKGNAMSGGGALPMASAVPEVAYDMAADDMLRSSATSDSGMIEPSQPPSNNAHGQKIIRTGDVSLESRQFDADFQSILDIVAQYGGYIESQSTSGVPYEADPNSYGRWGNITARVPSESLDGFISASKGIGNVTNASIHAEDVTAQYQDTQLQLETLTAQRTRLLELVAQATEVTDLIALEQELQSVQYRMDALTGNLKSWDARVEYSTVYIYLTEVKSYSSIQPVDPTLGERIQDAFYKSINGMIDLGQNILVGLTMAVPYLIILAGLGVIALIVVIIVRVAYRKKRKDTST